MVTPVSVCPRTPVFGVTPLTTGADARTAKAFAKLPLCVSGFVTVTVRPPIVALAAIVTLAVSCVAETKVQELTVIPLPKLHVAPLWKLLPVIPTLPSVCPCLPLLGVTPLTVGGGANMLKALGRLPLRVLGFVTVTVRPPSVDATPIVRFADICVAEVNVQLLTM